MALNWDVTPELEAFLANLPETKPMSERPMEVQAVSAVLLCRARIAELETRLRIWRDDYARSHEGTLVTIPVHQLIALIGEK